MAVVRMVVLVLMKCEVEERSVVVDRVVVEVGPSSSTVDHVNVPMESHAVVTSLPAFAVIAVLLAGDGIESTDPTTTTLCVPGCTSCARATMPTPH